MMIVCGVDLLLNNSRSLATNSPSRQTEQKMNRLVVNPNGPDPWEIELKEGTNRLGRGDDTDFKIADASVSSSHCYIIVNGNDVSIQDLGSTNGTFINDKPAQAASLQNGQTIRLGNVEMIFYADAPQPAAPTSGPGCACHGIAHAAEASRPVMAEVPPLLAPQFDLSRGLRGLQISPQESCPLVLRQVHPFILRFMREHKTTGGGANKTCRSCGNECAPLEVEFVAPAEKSFLASLPGAFIYPFRGSGVLILVFSAILFAALGARMAGLFSIISGLCARILVFLHAKHHPRDRQRGNADAGTAGNG